MREREIAIYLILELKTRLYIKRGAEGRKLEVEA